MSQTFGDELRDIGRRARVEQLRGLNEAIVKVCRKAAADGYTSAIVDGAFTLVTDADLLDIGTALGVNVVRAMAFDGISVTW